MQISPESNLHQQHISSAHTLRTQPPEPRPTTSISLPSTHTKADTLGPTPSWLRPLHKILLWPFQDMIDGAEIEAALQAEDMGWHLLRFGILVGGIRMGWVLVVRFLCAVASLLELGLE